MLAPMLAKLYISPTSTSTLIREVYSDISEAVEDKKLGLDATGRNSLYKIHVSLGKIVNALDKEAAEKEKETGGRGARMSSVTPSVMTSAAGDQDEDTTVLAKTPEPVEEEDEGDDTVIPVVKKEKGRGATEELVDELLSDGDVDMSGM